MRAHGLVLSLSFLLLFSFSACKGADAPEAAAAPAASATAPAESTEAFLDDLQERTFRFFWETTEPSNGLVPDRWPTPAFSSIAAVGFGLTAYPIGVERGYVTRDAARERTLTTLRFFWSAPQGPEPAGKAGHRGFFYHFLDMKTGERFEKVELSTIDTALLLAGMLTAQSYFDRDDPAEAEIRSLADQIYRRVDWKWASPKAPRVSHGWHPESGFIPYDWSGYNESMLLYVLALGSPTHAVDPSAWDAWVETYRWADFHGQEHVNFAPLFGHQYSHAWIDFRGIRDVYMRGRGIDYFENSRRATHAQRAYAMANPRGMRDYGENVWGLTACDGPLDAHMDVAGRSVLFHTYAARGAAATEIRDDGTIAPTAAGGSIAFAPEIVIPALQEMKRRYGNDLYQKYGFLDSFNPTFPTDVAPRFGRVVPGKGWFGPDYLGIDQGPILVMTENHRTGLIWKLLRKNPYIRQGLTRAGFTGGWLEEEGSR